MNHTISSGGPRPTDAAAARRDAAETARQRIRSPVRKTRSDDKVREDSPTSSEDEDSSDSDDSSNNNMQLAYADDDCAGWKDWSQGVESMVAATKVRQKRGKTFNPFVEFEDREMRLNWERRWLKDDDIYMSERVKGMRLGAVQARLSQHSMSRDNLYEDAVYFGTYSCGLRSLQQKKAEADLIRRRHHSEHRAAISVALPPMRTNAAKAAIENMEAAYLDKIKKGQAAPVLSLKSMKTVLQESSRHLHDRVQTPSGVRSPFQLLAR